MFGCVAGARVGGRVTAAKTPSARGRSNRRRGHDAERALAKWLRSNGFPHAERAVRTGWTVKDRASADPGDITGTPGLIWSVKDTATESHTVWRAELNKMILGQDNVEARGVIVHKRRGHASPGEWWVWLATPDVAALFGVRFYSGEWWRTTVGELAWLLRGAGYGTPPEPEDPALPSSVHGDGRNPGSAPGCTPASPAGDSGPADGDIESGECPRVPGPHSWRFDGDDPYIVCAWCDETRSTLTGRIVLRGAGA